MRKWAVGVVIIAAIGGVALALVSLQHHYQIVKGALHAPSFCNLSARFDCDLVAGSRYAVLFGQPVAGWGLLYFLVQCLFGCWVGFAPRTAERRSTVAVAWYCACCALPYPLFLVWVMATQLQTFCLTCLGMDLALLLIIAGWFLAAGGRAATSWSSLRRGWVGHGLTAAVIVGIGLIFLASTTKAVHKESQQLQLTRAQVAQGLAAFQKGSLFDLTIDPAAHPVWGNPVAKVTVVEFSDFQCPFCQVAAFFVRSALAEFRQQVRFIYLHHPLDATCNPYMEWPGHPFACLAARASVCAHQAGKFWELHDALFHNQSRLSQALIMQLARQVGLADTPLQQCLDDPATMAAVKADIELGHHVHINGTPTILINNRQVVHWRSRELLRAIVKAELER